jgi:hypothetical protein
MIPTSTRGTTVTAEWSVFTGSSDEWNARLRTLAFPSVHQGFRWAEHRRRFGWIPLRLVAHRDARVVAMAQANVRIVLRGICVVWVPGGPVGDLTECGDALRRTMLVAVGARFTTIRINPDRPTSEDDDSTLTANGWSKSRRTLLSGSTLHYRPDLPESDRLSHLTRNWRHNLRRGQKRGLDATRWLDPSPDLVRRTYEAMHEFKGLDRLSDDVTREWIDSVLDAYGDDCIMVRCDDPEGNLLALRGALVLGDRAFDTFAAATPEGRKTYASYVAFWKLMELCAARGVTTYDMGGADAVNNRGVYDFKQGTGATSVTTTGEWEYARPRLLGNVVARRIARQGN